MFQVYFETWLSDSKDLAKLYSCRSCKATGNFRGRKCFKFQKLGKVDLVNIPIVVDEKVKHSDISLTKEELFKEVVKLWMLEPSFPIFEIFMNYYLHNQNKVCPVPFLEEGLEEYIEWQDMCERYKSLPFKGALESQPKHVMEVFNLIVAAKNQYMRNRDVGGKD